MKFRLRHALPWLLTVGLIGCAEPAPMVIGFNGDSVEIQQSTLFDEPDASLPEIRSEAARICGTAGKVPEYASSRPDYDNGTTIHLFLCL